MKIARILSASCGFPSIQKPDPARRLVANRGMILEVLDRAAKFRPDFVCFPELILQAGTGWWKGVLRFAEPIPGQTFDLVAEKARKLGSHVILTMAERAGRRTYNTAALIGRDGRLIGKYRKFHATGYEMKAGITPGDDIPVWETDCGRVGIAICYDLNFPIVGITLARRQAQCVFFPTMFYGGRRLDSWAMDYGFHFIRCHGAGSLIVDPTGQTLAIEGPPEKLRVPGGVVKWAFAETNLDHKTYHLDFHYEKMEAIQAKYGPDAPLRRMPEEGQFNLLSASPARTVDDLEKEFKLQSLRAYLDESAAIRERALKRRTRR